ncbi:hypothetical protein TVAG_380730 [Trichomonas vaginalis G3]|uniref:Uncharacterized protein n=1 Tax=Trichomonas vaginalis (strain ATCC PRA-98 / G3) TaxID=412133 RepID=A2FWF0_TRIV3|nr:hypothetical protein TVAGG3_0327880 [Trichomonas vaginalis G3]EAX90777.1 hypothetical protein TVAG_380730 [Trichomonas vaginalis G3]KAI5529754.1 hypothetical protein TVAGG3_0327880 [Trichomonas vaginalis G3]|eukprot:XP_001303707.1 hypothetical protein [Trichomonas vaginalis G3]
MSSSANANHKHRNGLRRIFFFKDGQPPVVRDIDTPDWKKRRIRKRQHENLKQLGLMLQRLPQCTANMLASQPMRQCQTIPSPQVIYQSQPQVQPQASPKADPLIQKIPPIQNYGLITQISEEISDPNADAFFEEIAAFEDQDFDIEFDPQMEFF